MPQLQFDYGYMGDGGPLQIACFLVGADTSSGAIHATMVPDSKKMDMPCVVAATAKWCVTWGMNVSVYTKTKKEFFSCYWTKWREKCRPEGQDWQILRQMSPTEPSEQWSRGESRLHSAWTCQHKSGSSQRQNPVF